LALKNSQVKVVLATGVVFIVFCCCCSVEEVSTAVGGVLEELPSGLSSTFFRGVLLTV
jgi:hypothetical protein